MSFENDDDWNLGDIEIPDDKHDGLQFISNPHIARGKMFEVQGLLREAIDEYMKEHDRPILSHIDADIVQSSYWFKGRVYRQLGELENAIEALQKSRELLKNYGIGASPHEDLAEIFIFQGKMDEAIEICQESLEEAPSWPMKQLLNKALELIKEQKQGGEDC